MDSKQAVLTFPSSRKPLSRGESIIIKLLDYIKNNNILNIGKIVINDKYKSELGLNNLSEASIDNSIEWLEFFKLVEQTSKNEFRITDKGKDFFDYYNKNGEIDYQNIYYLLIDTTIPYKIGCTYKLKDRKYRVFETMFKVFLYLDELGVKINSRQFDEVYYYEINDDNYKNYKAIGDKIRQTNSFSHTRDSVTDYLFSALELFKVLKKEEKYDYVLDDNFKKVLKENLIMESNNGIKLPIISGKTDYNKLPYSLDFISFTIYEYLFNGTAMDKIEQKYYNNEARGFSAKEIIDFYRINNKEFNKGMYTNVSKEYVINKLLQQNNQVYIDIANALLSNPANGEKYIPEFKKEDIIVTGAINKIYYGVPGCGKSTAVKKEYEKDNNIIKRITFHPEYSNSDFIGQIIPKLDGNNVIYDFKAGIFTEALLTAFKNPDRKNILIIEEINRGNASAIFGDIFQLLDRDETGMSRFPINNTLIRDYLLKNDINIGKIYLPSNLWIIATMNSSDQNVFTLDTAFKRRWEMHRVSNVIPKYAKLAGMFIPGTMIRWDTFVNCINDAITEKNATGLNSEDKQVGVYFVGEKDLVEEYDDSRGAAEAFAEKVLHYIWEDIAKLNPSDWFIEDCNTFEKLLNSFYEKHLDVFKDINFNESKSNVEGK